VIQIGEHKDGLILPVRAQPNARKTGFIGEQAGSLKVGVTAPPEDGKANKALLEILRELLDLKRSQIAILSGLTSREKKFLISGIKREDLEARISKLTV
jgi:uncharacterized protein